MKQNERWLVYAVTGFLALILVVAVLFHDDKGETGKVPKAADFSDVLGVGKSADVLAGAGATDKNATGLPSPSDVKTEQPLNATPKPMLAADLVAQQLGQSRRDRTVRFVHAKNGDSLDSLVRRWCGDRDGALAETKSLNEELVVLRVGQEVAVPWVDDDEVLAAIEAKKPKTLLAQDASASGHAAPSPTDSPSFVLPGTGSGNEKAGGSEAGSGAGSGGANRPKPAVAGGTTYTVKDGDALWRIADRTYGRKNADRMVRAIKAANPGLGDTVRAGQRIVLPKADE